MRLTDEERREINELWDTAVIVLTRHGGLQLKDAQEMASVYTTAVGDRLITVRSVVRILLRLSQSNVVEYAPPMTLADLLAEDYE